MKKIVFLLLYSITLLAQLKSIKVNPPSYNQKYITILDAKKVTFKKQHSLKFTELSDLAYDKEEETLYAISDRAILYTLNIKIKNNKIKSLQLLNTQQLKSKKLRKLSKKRADAEGMDMQGSHLLISFERVPAIKLFDTSAKCIKKYKLPKKLSNIKNYKSKNDALESVTYSEKYGYITAPEKPLKSKKQHTLYSKEKEWKFKRNGSITALQMISKNKILIIEREFNSFTFSRTITISLFSLKKSQLQELLVMRSNDGWNIDNIEGVTQINNKHFLLISDDNNSPFQETQLILFELHL